MSATFIELISTIIESMSNGDEGVTAHSVVDQEDPFQYKLTTPFESTFPLVKTVVVVAPFVVLTVQVTGLTYVMSDQTLDVPLSETNVLSP